MKLTGLSAMEIFLVLSLLVTVCAATPLDDYVNAPDPTYEYRDLGDPWDGDGYTSYFINLTSQLWLSRESLSSGSCSQQPAPYTTLRILGSDITEFAARVGQALQAPALCKRCTINFSAFQQLHLVSSSVVWPLELLSTINLTFSGTIFTEYSIYCGSRASDNGNSKNL